MNPRFRSLATLAILALGTAGLSAQITGRGWNVSPRIDPPPHDAPRAPAPEDGPQRGQAGGELLVADAVTPELQALADGLGNDPFRIFDFVYNKIRYVHYYGCKKGATLTLLERAGNDYDQCALLVALLRASGVTANYRQGGQTIPLNDPSGWDLEHWFGGTLEGISRYLASAGTPGVVRVNGDSVHFERVWVEAVIGGAVSVLDPSFKRTTHHPGIDLGAAMGYSRAELFAAAGGTVSGAGVEAIDYGDLSAKLVEYSQSLEANLAANHFDAYVPTVFGGQTIDPQLTGTLADLPAAPRYGNPLGIEPVAIQSYERFPSSAGMTFRFRIGDLDQTFFTAELQGRKLSLTFEPGGNRNARLWLDDVLVASETNSAGTSNAIMNLTFNDPSPTAGGQYLDRVANESYERNGTYALIYAFDANEDLLIRRQRRLSRLRAQGLSETGREVSTEKLNIVGLNWLYQTSLAAQYLARRKGIFLSHQHRFGRVGEEPSLNNPGLNSHYIDVGFQTNTNTSDSLSDEDERVFFVQASSFASAMEHGVFEQSRFFDNPSASTINIIAAASAVGDKIFRADAASFPGVRAQLQNYGGATLNNIQNVLNADPSNEVLLPADGSLSFGAWNGTGYALVQADQISMIIGGGFLGGFNSEQSPFFPYDGDYIGESTEAGIFGSAFVNELRAQLLRAGDPVIVSNGSFMLDSLDLAAGSGEPEGWAFKRHYQSSNASLNKGGIGYGWDHNYNSAITEVSEATASFGSRDLMGLIPVAVAVHAAIDAYEAGDTSKEWAVSALCSKWAVDGIVGNMVCLTLPPKTHLFARRADGSYRGPPGSKMTLTGSEGAWVVTQQGGSTLAFNADNRLASISDLQGRTMSLTYGGAEGLLQRVTDAYGRQLDLNYSGGNLTSLSDGFGRTVVYAYTGGHLTNFTDPEGAVRSYGYDGGGRLILSRDSLQQAIVRNLYDDRGRVIEQRTEDDPGKTWKYFYGQCQTIVEDPRGSRTVYHFDERRRTTAVTDATGKTSQMRYSGRNQIVERETSGGAVSRFSYDSFGNLIEIETPGGETTAFDYDGLKRLVRVTDGAGAVSELVFNPGNDSDKPNAMRILQGPGSFKETKFEYHNPGAGGNGGKLKRIISPLGRSASIEYDATGLIRSTSAPGEGGAVRTTQYGFTSRGDLDHLINPRGVRTNYTLNGRRQITQMTVDPGGPDEAATNVGYDANGLIERITDPSGIQIRFSYTTAGKVKRTYTLNETATEADDPCIERFYDNVDLLIRTEDEMDRAVQYTYFDNYLPSGIQQTPARTATFGYDENNSLATVTDGTGLTVRATFDPVLNEREITEPYLPPNANDPATAPAGTRSSTSILDSLGQLAVVGNRNGDAFTFTYDEEGHREDSITPLTNRQSFEYDDDGSLSRIAEPSGQVTDYFYHPSSGRLDRIVDAMGVVTLGLDPVGNVETVTQGGRTITRQYDNQNRVTSYNDGEGNTIGYQYHANGQVKRITYPGAGRFVDYAYYRNGLLKSVTDWAGRRTSYSYYEDRRLRTITRPNGTTRFLDYNELGEIRTLAEAGPNGELIAFYAYEYDAVGKVRAKVSSPAPQSYSLPSLVCTVDAENRLASCNGEAVNYDADGNMIQGPGADGVGMAYAFNPRNQLASAGSAGYDYNAEGQRTGVSGGGDTTTFISDGVGFFSRVLERTTNGAKIFSVYGNGLLYDVDEAGRVVTYHYDHLGSTVALTDSAGAITDRFEYSPYGTVTRRTGSTSTPFQYVGQWGVQTDPNGLLFMRARYYNPYLRRFINADPIGLVAGLNSHRYVDGDPLSLVDPNGEFGFVGALIGGAVGGVIGGAVAAWQGKDIIAGAAGGAVGGAFVGSGAGIVTAIAYGAAGGLAGNYTEQAVTNYRSGQNLGDSLTNINGAQLATSTVLGGAFGGLGQYGANRLGAYLNPSDELATIYRGTDLGSELNIFSESGAVLSDAGRSAYQSARYGGASVQEALSAANDASSAAHAQQLRNWYGNLDDYVQAHGEWGQEISVFGERSLVSFTTDPSVTSRFGSNVIELQVPSSRLIPQTLPGSSEAEVLLRNGWIPGIK